MASVLASGRASWRRLLQQVELGRRYTDHVMYAPPLTLCRPFAALGRAGRPRTVAAAAAVKEKAATAEKKPPSAYALFMKDHFPKTKSTLPNADFGAVSKAVSSQWKNLGDAEKKRQALRRHPPPDVWVSVQALGGGTACGSNINCQ